MAARKSCNKREDHLGVKLASERRRGGSVEGVLLIDGVEKQRLDEASICTASFLTNHSGPVDNLTKNLANKSSPFEYTWKRT